MTGCPEFVPGPAGWAMPCQYQRQLATCRKCGRCRRHCIDRRFQNRPNRGRRNGIISASKRRIQTRG